VILRVPINRGDAQFLLGGPLSLKAIGLLRAYSSERLCCLTPGCGKKRGEEDPSRAEILKGASCIRLVGEGSRSFKHKDVSDCHKKDVGEEAEWQGRFDFGGTWFPVPAPAFRPQTSK